MSIAEPPGENDKIYPICAIGASAGGVSALRKLFHALPDDLGLVYVVILHLSPEYPSAMAEILSTCTDMPVDQVEDQIDMRPDRVFVIPPDRELLIEGNTLAARPFTEPRGKRAPVDVFFNSIASGRGDGMAVVLSGTGSDGSRGLRAVHEAGGVIFAQDPAEAEFGEMPQNAIATGKVNFVAPIVELAERLVEVARSKMAVRSLDEDGAANDLRRIVSLLYDRTGHDFSSYKRATVMRRVLRRMQVCRLTTLEAYAELVRTKPNEAQALFDDLLISVTRFFRDGEAFDVLTRDVIGGLFDRIQNESDPTIRVWSVGCATGEEAYSLAILFHEEAARRNVRLPLQIFASDLDESALAEARDGRYPRAIEADISEERLKAFFIDEGTHYRVRKDLRENVLFASHSVLKDPPFLRLDLIACRNLLIYLEKSLQEQLLNLFHYALKPGCSLFLGSAETADISPDFFVPIDREARIFRARGQDRRRLPTLPSAPSGQASVTPNRPAELQRDKHLSANELHMAALEQGAPPSVLVNDAQQIMHMSPNAGRFVLHSGGAFSGKLPSVVRPELRLDLKIALDRAFESGLSTMTHPVAVIFDDVVRRVALHVAPASDLSAGEGQALVLFLDAGPSDPDFDSTSDPDTIEPDQMQRLRSELKVVQEALVRSRGEHETSVEDLRAANEELQSINEEYRSTAEELETSKEELQSMNEELQTVNTELKSKLESISSAHNDLQNLTSATEIGTLFLDYDLRIRIFTPLITELFSITTADIGRVITDFTHRLRYDAVERIARDVLRDLAPIEIQVEALDGRCFLMRLRPYRTVEDRIDGVVLTFVDVTEHIEMERKLIESQRRYRMLFNSIDEGFCVIEMLYDAQGAPSDFRFMEVNEAFQRQTGLNDVEGKTIKEMVPGHESHWFEIYGRIAQSGEAERFEESAAAMGRYFEVFAFPTNEPHQLGVLFRDITERKVADEQREMLTHELSHRVKNSLAVVQALARQPGKDLDVDQYRERFVGRIRALAVAHDQLLESNWESVDLAVLTDSILSPYRTRRRVLKIEGPDVQLSPKQGLGLGLIFHELATNAVKYGALSEGGGNLTVSWEIEKDPEKGPNVTLIWQERDGPETGPPDHEGFGTKLLKRAAAYELDGTAELSFESAGLTVKMHFPQI